MPDDSWVREVDVDILRAFDIAVANITVAQGTDTTSVLLLETADFILLEGGDFLLLEVNNG